MDEANAEALRAREAIEEKVRVGDYRAARTLILEALKVNQSLNQASEMLTVCETLCSAEMELPGSGIDWYWVLQLFPSAEPAAIEAQYQKLVSLLEPVKKDFPCTDLALESVANAYLVLSDPVKRAAFDSKRNEFRDIGEVSDAPSSSRPKRAAEEDCSGDGNVGEKQKKICALEASWVTDQVSSEGNCIPSVAQMETERDFYDFESNRRAESFSVGQVWAAYDQENMPRRYGKVVNIMPEKFQLYVTWFKSCSQSSNDMKWHNAGFSVPCGTFALEQNKVTLCGISEFSHMLSTGLTNQPFEIYPKKGDVWAIYSHWHADWCSNPWMRQGCSFGIVEISSDYLKDVGVRVVYLVKVDGFKNVYQRYSEHGNELSLRIPAEKFLMFSHKVPAFRFVGGEMGGISNGMLELDPLAVPNDLVEDLSSAISAFVDSFSQPKEEVNCSDEASITHLTNPSSSLTDTGGSSSGIKSRRPKLSPKDFVVEQVWAVYDGPDGMPRSYVKVVDVVSPTNVCVTFLEPHPMLDEEIHWVEESLPIVCGIFRAGRAEMILEMSRFSHIVHCQRSSKKSFYRIFPMKGEVWAVYKNWSCSWRNSDISSYQCKMVEVLSDFSEEGGVRVCSLVEVKGFLTFFQRQMCEGFQLTRQLSRLELLSFSHQIPAFTVVGIKNQEIPKGSWHLEPNALPPKFIN